MENQHENIYDTSHFFILIPSEVLKDSRISEGAKLLYGEILFLSQKENCCFASNDYFMKLNGISKRTVVSRMKELKDQGFIRTEVIRNNTNRQVEKRNIYVLKDFSKMDRHMAVEADRNVTIENLILGEHHNVFLTRQELENLQQKFSKQLFDMELQTYSTWKKTNNANPKSDYETFEKWLFKKQSSYKSNTTAVRTAGIDEVSEETLENLPF